MAAEAAGLGAILLAAGGSRRLGCSKQLIEIDGQPLVLRQARLLLDLEPALVVVVTGARGDEVRESLAGMAVKCVDNPDWARGMGTSLARGVRAMPERVRAALVLLCDQWKVGGRDIENLVNAWAEEPLAAVLADYGETTGPPAILPRAMFERLARLRGDTGARRILKSWKGKTVRLPMPGAAKDIDSPADLDR